MSNGAQRSTSFSPHILNKHWGKMISTDAFRPSFRAPLELLFVRSILLFGEVCKSRGVVASVVQCMSLWHVVVLYNGTDWSKKKSRQLWMFLACKYMKSTICVTLVVLLVTLPLQETVPDQAPECKECTKFLCVLLIRTHTWISYHKVAIWGLPRPVCLLNVLSDSASWGCKGWSYYALFSFSSLSSCCKRISGMLVREPAFIMHAECINPFCLLSSCFWAC
jgi:hypothetical protein